MKTEDEELVFGLGCIPSELDGTEKELTPDDKLELPNEFDWKYCLPPVRNQGATSTCVCQSLTCVLDFFKNSRNGTPNICNEFSIDELYGIRANKSANGMTFKEAFDYVRHHGLQEEFINGYAKIGNINAAKYAIVMFGPILGGLPVYSQLTDKFWQKTSNHMKGGHAITLVGYNKDGFILRNSWGMSYGKGGYSILSYEDFTKYCFECWTVLL